jgi:hypothetical protein
MSTYKVTKRCILRTVANYSTWHEELEFILLLQNLWDAWQVNGAHCGPIMKLEQEANDTSGGS